MLNRGGIPSTSPVLHRPFDPAYFRRVRWWLLSLGWLFWGCGGEKQGRTYVRIALFSPYTSLDPLYARDLVSVWLTQQLFEGLMRYDDSLQLIPGLAARYDVLDGGRVYRFYLRRGVTYHRRPERTLRAEDVLYNWHRLADPTWASPGSYVFEGLIEGWHAYRAGQAQSISGLRAIGDSIVEVRLEKPYAPFLHLLTLPYTYIALPESVAALGRALWGAPSRDRRPFACSIWKQAGWWSCSAGKAIGAARRAYPASSFNGLAIVSGPTKPSIGARLTPWRA